MEKSFSGDNTKMTNNKTYKLLIINIISMLPGDLQGSPDESFYINLLLTRV